MEIEEESLQEKLDYIKQNKEILFEDAKNQTARDKLGRIIIPNDTIPESLEKSLKEVQLMRDGKLPKKSWDEFKKELNDK